MEERKTDFMISDNHYGGGPRPGQLPNNTSAGQSTRAMTSMSSEQF